MMKLIKGFTRQCCNALQGVSCWNDAISEIVEVVPHKVCASVCGQCRTISQEKYYRVLVVLPGRKLAAMHSPKMQKVVHIAGFILSIGDATPSYEDLLIIAVVLFAHCFSGKFTQKIQ